RHEMILVGIPTLFGGLAIVVDRALRWRRRRQARTAHGADTHGLATTSGGGDDALAFDEKFPWQIWATIGGSIVGYFVAREVAFKLFLPQRQLTYTLTFLVQSGLPLIMWCGARAVLHRNGGERSFARRHERALAVA